MTTSANAFVPDKRFTLLLLALLLLCVVSIRDIHAATISGRMLMKDGNPLQGGIAVAFDFEKGPPPAPEMYFRAPDFMSDIRSDGTFEILLPQGKYYIAAVKRQDGSGGPPREGDVYLIARDDKGKARTVSVPKGGEVVLGDIASGEVFRPSTDPLHPVTAVSGRVLDNQDDPLESIIIFAELIKPGKHNALFVSPETDSSGRFRIMLPSGGTYHIGIWDEGAPITARDKFSKTVKIATGEELQNIDLRR